MKKKEDISTRDFHLATFLNVNGFGELNIKWVTPSIHYFTFPYSKKLEKLINKYQNLLGKEEIELARKHYVEKVILRQNILLKLSRKVS